jgi:predicted Rossmann fold nucleotide-binding protein DprA/Smf involved in DNA uptake
VQFDTALPWLALCLTRGLASRLCARLLKHFGSPEAVFKAPLRQLQACELPAETAQAVKRDGFARAGKELAAIVERTGLNSSDVLATLFDLEMNGFIPQLPGKQFSKIMF